MNHRRTMSKFASILAMAACACAGAAEIEAPAVRIIGTAPLPGVERPIEQIPSNIRTLSDASLDDACHVALPDAIAARSFWLGLRYQLDN